MRTLIPLLLVCTLAFWSQAQIDIQGNDLLCFNLNGTLETDNVAVMVDGVTYTSVGENLTFDGVPAQVFDSMGRVFEAYGCNQVTFFGDSRADSPNPTDVQSSWIDFEFARSGGGGMPFLFTEGNDGTVTISNMVVTWVGTNLLNGLRNMRRWNGPDITAPWFPSRIARRAFYMQFFMLIEKYTTVRQISIQERDNNCEGETLLVVNAEQSYVDGFGNEYGQKKNNCTSNEGTAMVTTIAGNFWFPSRSGGMRSSPWGLCFEREDLIPKHILVVRSRTGHTPTSNRFRPGSNQFVYDDTLRKCGESDSNTSPFATAPISQIEQVIWEDQRHACSMFMTCTAVDPISTYQGENTNDPNHRDPRWIQYFDRMLNSRCLDNAPFRAAPTIGLRNQFGIGTMYPGTVLGGNVGEGKLISRLMRVTNPLPEPNRKKRFVAGFSATAGFAAVSGYAARADFADESGFDAGQNRRLDALENYAEQLPGLFDEIEGSINSITNTFNSQIDTLAMTSNMQAMAINGNAMNIQIVNSNVANLVAAFYEAQEQQLRVNSQIAEGLNLAFVAQKNASLDNAINTININRVQTYLRANLGLMRNMLADSRINCDENCCYGAVDLIRFTLNQSLIDAGPQETIAPVNRQDDQLTVVPVTTIDLPDISFSPGVGGQTSRGLGLGAIMGISVGVIVAVIVVGGLIALFCIYVVCKRDKFGSSIPLGGIFNRGFGG